MKDPEHPWLIVGVGVAIACLGLGIATATGELPPPGWENPVDVAINATAGVNG